MLQYERQKNILDYLESRHSATIKELAAAVYTSEASVRRDVAELAAQGYVERIYGGVLLAKYKNSVVPVNLRDISNSAGKELAAEKAAALIQDGDTVILDASTTVFRICHYIKNQKHLKLITNNLRICQELADCENIQVYCTGGALVGSSSCFLGSKAEEFLHGVHGDLMFFSAQGIAQTGEITDVSEQEIAMRKVMLSCAEKRFFVCDSSKLGIRRSFLLCRKEELNGIICDRELNFME